MRGVWGVWGICKHTDTHTRNYERPTEDRLRAISCGVNCCTRICVYSGHELNILFHIQIVLQRAVCVVLFYLSISTGYSPTAEHTVDLSMQVSEKFKCGAWTRFASPTNRKAWVKESCKLKRWFCVSELGVCLYLIFHMHYCRFWYRWYRNCSNYSYNEM